MPGVLLNMLDMLFNVGGSLSILVLLVGAFLALAEASDTATGPDENRRLRQDSPDY